RMCCVSSKYTVPGGELVLAMPPIMAWWRRPCQLLSVGAEPEFLQRLDGRRRRRAAHEDAATLLPEVRELRRVVDQHRARRGVRALVPRHAGDDLHVRPQVLRDPAVLLRLGPVAARQPREDGRIERLTD